MPDEEHPPFLQEEAEVAAKPPKIRGGEAMIDILTSICLQRDKEGMRMTENLDSMPCYHTPKEKKPNLQLYQN